MLKMCRRNIVYDYVQPTPLNPNEEGETLAEKMTCIINRYLLRDHTRFIEIIYQLILLSIVFKNSI